MKLSLIAVCSLLVGCATGVVDEVSQEPEVTVVTKIPAPKPAPVLEDQSDAGPSIKCVIDAYWVGTCYVVDIYCEDKPVQTEIACQGPRLWPWERDPYPPPYDIPGNRE